MMRIARTRALPLLIVTGSLLIASSCGKDGSPTTPSPAGSLTPIRATVIADYTLGQGRAQGEVVFRCVSPSLTTGVRNAPFDINRTGRLGEPVNLGSFPAGMSLSFDIEIQGDGALKRIFRNVPLAGDVVLTTNILRLDGFDWSGFWYPASGDPVIGPDHKNKRFNAPDLTIYCPQLWVGSTWCRVVPPLSETIWADVAAAGTGFFRSMPFAYPEQRQPPPAVFVGDVFVYTKSCADPAGVAAHDFTYPDGSLNALIITLAGDWETWKDQVDDAMIPGSQPYLKNKLEYLRFLFRRPAGDEFGYRLYESHEEQEGFSGTIAAAGGAPTGRAGRR